MHSCIRRVCSHRPQHYAAAKHVGHSRVIYLYLRRLIKSPRGEAFAQLYDFMAYIRCNAVLARDA